MMNHAANPRATPSAKKFAPRTPSTKEADDRAKKFGLNQLREQEKASGLRLFLTQLKNPLLIILTIGAVISGYTGHWVDAMICVIVIFNALISFWQELKAEQSLTALSKLSAPKATVRRNGDWSEILAAQIVPGDIVRLKAGDIIPTDMRFAEANRLQVDEAALTGESEPVDKHAEKLSGEDALLAERFNMGFMSTQVTNGTAVEVVTATGMNTEVGHIADLMAFAKEPKTRCRNALKACRTFSSLRP
jgi:Ca2+-transporting ATPase